MTEKIVLAFSGGLDTSYCVLALREQGFEVHTVFVDTGGIPQAEIDWIEMRKRHEEPTRKMVHARLVLDAIARAEKIEVDDATVDSLAPGTNLGADPSIVVGDQYLHAHTPGLRGPVLPHRSPAVASGG